MSIKRQLAAGLDYAKQLLSSTPLRKSSGLKNLYDSLYTRLTPTGETWVDIKNSEIKINASEDIGRRIYYGQHEVEIKDVLSRLVSEGDTIIDVGGHYGYYTAIFRELVGQTGEVVVVEPNPENAKLLENTIERNRWNNVKLVQKAISNNPGKVNLNSVKNGEGRSFIDEAHGRNELSERVDTTFEVESVTLSSLIEKYSIESVDLIKIDIEGAELEAIKSLNDDFDAVATMIIEIHSNQSSETYRDIYNLLSPRGELTYIGEDDVVDPTSLSTTSANLLWERSDNERQ